MIVGIVGSRNFTDYALLCKSLKNKTISGIVSGGAKGADKLAEKYAKENGIPIEIILPNYKEYSGKQAPIMRNFIIINKSESVIAFWDGKSRGTKMVIDYCKKINKNCKIYEIILKN